jgi:AcrR family transcriptional regulator
MKTRGRPRAIPRRAPGRGIVEAILQSAMAVLSRDGFQRLTTNRIAEQAGVSIGSVYQYFPDKHAIVAAIGRELEHRALRLFEQVVEQAPAQSIAEVVGALVRGLAHESFGGLLVRREILRQVPRAWLADASERVDMAVKAELAKLLSVRGDVREGDPEQMAFVAMHAGRGGARSRGLASTRLAFGRGLSGRGRAVGGEVPASHSNRARNQIMSCCARPA